MSETITEPTQPTVAPHQVIHIPLDEIKVGTRMRQDLGDLEELAASIAEVGLIHPLTISPTFDLVDGGRRYAAIHKHLKDSIGKSVPCYVKDCENQVHLRMMELIANIRRKDMDWKEKVMSIAEVHRLSGKDSILKGENWTQAMTGELLGVSTGNVSTCLELSKLLKIQTHPVRRAESLLDALRILAQMKEDEIVKYESQFARQAMVPLPSTGQVSVGAQPLTLSIDALIRSQPVPGAPIPTPTPTPAGQPVPSRPQMVVQLSRFFNMGDCLEFMAQSKGEIFDHIVTDSPYAIDMENLEQGNKERVEDEHDTKANLLLMHDFFPRAFHVLKDRGFLVVWYDQEHHEFICSNAEAAGFSVCRWPLVWVKTSRCQNQAAQYNFTKATEMAIVCRKGNATLVKPQPVNYWIGSNDEDKKRLNHPFVKPEQLWRWIYTAIATKGQTIYDPFAGVGSSCLAAARAGYTPFGTELKEIHYNRLIVEFKELMKTWHGQSHELTFV